MTLYAVPPEDVADPGELMASPEKVVRKKGEGRSAPPARIRGKDVGARRG